MPFWWRRRRKFWSGRRRRRQYKPRYKARRRRQRRYRRTPRRRRRRRKRAKVRRKKQKITLQQWQPDRIVKCKIRGLGILVAGSEGTQFQCFTDDIAEYPPPKSPGGGGFGLQVFNLKYLYEQWVARKNIWTKSNDYTDLARYTGTKIRFFRHHDTDFVVSYNRMPPFKLEKETYIGCHPVNLLLAKHHKVILSRKSKPTGKNTVTIHIRPPKLMTNHWFMQQDLCKEDLFEIRAAACNFNYSYFGPNTQSQLITFSALNTNFFQKHNWAQNHGDHSYLPYATYPATTTVTFTYKDSRGQEQSFEMPPNKDYYYSVNKDTGFFNWKVLTATKVSVKAGITHETPMTLARYNPMLDTGDKTYVWVVSVVSDSNWQTPRDTDLVVTGYPLWMAFYGLWNYILRSKSKDYLTQAMFVCKSPAIQLISKTNQTVFPILDMSFIKGQMPWDELLTDTQKKLWYPTAYKQQQIINTIVESGPYIPFHIPLTLSGEAPKLQINPFKIHAQKKSMISPITCKALYKSLTRSNKNTNNSLEPGTLEGDSLQSQLLRECTKTSKLIHLSSLMNQKLRKKRQKHHIKSNSHKKKHKKSRKLSSHSAKKVHAKNKTSSSSSNSSSSSSNSSRKTSSTSS
nr:MAG: ORF1 [Torque teno midi virus]